MDEAIERQTYLKDKIAYFENNKRSKEYVAHQAKVHSVAWSCDGSRLASGSFDKTVTIWTLDSDRLRTGATPCARERAAQARNEAQHRGPTRNEAQHRGASQERGPAPRPSQERGPAPRPTRNEAQHRGQPGTRPSTAAPPGTRPSTAAPPGTRPSTAAPARNEAQHRGPPGRGPAPRRQPGTRPSTAAHQERGPAPRPPGTEAQHRPTRNEGPAPRPTRNEAKARGPTRNEASTGAPARRGPAPRPHQNEASTAAQPGNEAQHTPAHQERATQPPPINDPITSTSNYSQHLCSIHPKRGTTRYTQAVWISFVGIRPSTDVLVTASLGQKPFALWDARAGKSTHSVNTKGENINICWSNNGHTIAVGNKEDLLTFVDVRTLKVKHEEQFKFEVNEIAWNKENDQFFLTNGNGCVVILSWPDMKVLHTITAHPANCICIEFDPSGKYFAAGSADALTSLWDVSELTCIQMFSRLDWPVRTLSFSYDSQLLASASEDLFIDIAYVHTGEKVAQVTTQAPTFTVAWHPTKHLLAYACDDKDKHDRDTGGIWLYGLANSNA
eukprot:Em0010g1029a